MQQRAACTRRPAHAGVCSPESCEQLCPSAPSFCGADKGALESQEECVPRAHSMCGATDSPQQLLKWKCLVPPPTSPRALDPSWGKQAQDTHPAQ